jgi:hypothetical protein
MSRLILKLLPIFIAVSAVFAYQKDHDKKRSEGPRENVFWVDPGDPSIFDFQYGVGGIERQPTPPFFFVNEDLSRTTPKANVMDERGAAWNIKWGVEARPSAFCTRFVGACGYLVEPEYFVTSGRIESVSRLQRVRKFISDDGQFVDARFQLRTKSPRYLKGEYWPLKKNPFEGTPAFQGMRILILLLSNWDQRDSNFGIFEDLSGDKPRYLYVQTDWGASLGKWGNLLTRTKWNCKDFAGQTQEFVKGVEGNRIKWGFSNWDDIQVSDVQWLLQYLGRITDAQIRQGMAAVGATESETECYTRSLRDRIEQLQLATTAAVSSSTVQGH